MNELKQFFLLNPGIRLPRSKAGLFNMSDRQFRRAIETFREKDNMAIISTSKQRGYVYLDKDLVREKALRTAAEIMVREIHARRKRLLKMIRPVEKLLQKNEQLRFEGV
jgi:hypothetical protein